MKQTSILPENFINAVGVYKNHVGIHINHVGVYINTDVVYRLHAEIEKNQILAFPVDK